jgi:hypothetical protein
MKVFMLLMFLHLSAVNPNVTVNLTGVTTVNQGLVQLNRAFPDWRQHYAVDEFDCSEMSAFVYAYFKACGLKPELKIGYNFKPGQGWGHAWVVCQGQIIECTWLKVNRNVAFYRDITPVTVTGEGKEKEFDWWNSGYLKEQMKPKLGGE